MIYICDTPSVELHTSYGEAPDFVNLVAYYLREQGIVTEKEEVAYLPSTRLFEVAGSTYHLYSEGDRDYRQYYLKPATGVPTKS